MRPFYHPPVGAITVEGILYALSDPVRAQIYAQLLNAGCTRNCTTFLDIQANGRPLPKSTLSQHLKVLREAGLVRSERQGVEVHNRARCEDLKNDFGPMITEIIKAYRGTQGES